MQGATGRTCGVCREPTVCRIGFSELHTISNCPREDDESGGWSRPMRPLSWVDGAISETRSAM